MERYTIYCTAEQIRKALELGAPIIIETEKIGLPNISFGYHRNTFITPTAEQMISFIESISEIQITIEKQAADRFRVWVKERCTPLSDIILICSYKSRKEATLAAIDATLDYLITNNNK